MCHWLCQCRPTGRLMEVVREDGGRWGDVAVAANGLAHLEAVHLRQHDVEDDQLEIVLLEHRQSITWPGGAGQLEIELRKVLSQ